ncbi:MAG: hypothetical protein H7Y11_06855, partial [Armatimonadetes bacterium]|nr:hypothetical protein [Anaerolineae bacterium]
RSSAVDVNPTNAIIHRLTALLSYLDIQDPGGNWKQYITAEGLPLWSNIVLSGHSQGGGHAALIAKQVVVARVIQFASTADYLLRQQQPAPWLSNASATPPDHYYGLGHVNDEAVKWQALQANWRALGMDAFGTPVDIDTTPPPYAQSHSLVMSSQPGSPRRFHGSMVVDPWLALDANGQPNVLPAWQYLLTFNPETDTDTANTGAPAAQAAGGFAVSYQAGMSDLNGNYLGGTELRVLAAHQGKLYAGIETWMDQPAGTGDPAIGAQIFVQDAADAAWRLDWGFDERIPNGRGRRDFRNEGVTALESLTFTTDGEGNVLAEPVTLLIAGLRDFQGLTSVYVRDDTANTWVESPIYGQDARFDTATVRSLVVYQDTVTGVDRVFAGAHPVGVFSGVYDATQPGLIRWDAAPELSGNEGRPMAFAVANGVLHTAAAPRVLRRLDGAAPRWEEVYRYELNTGRGGNSGLRGLTTVPNPSGMGESLLAALEGGRGKMVRLDPQPTLPYRAVLELDIMANLSAAWGYDTTYVVVANSDMTWIPDPTTGEAALFISVQHHPAQARDDAVYYIRRMAANGEPAYTLVTIDNTQLDPPIVLNSTRAISLSPFAEDNGRVVYIGGYDADNVPSHNTAYALRASIEAAFSGN